MGIRTKGDDLKQMDDIVSNLILKGQPLTHIHAEHGEKLGVTERTLYNYIDAGIFSIGNIDLRRKVGYRPRKKKREQSVGFANIEHRKGRTYDDFLSYMERKPKTPVVEMDTLFGVREQGKRLLTINFNDNNLMLLLLMRDGKADTVIEIFDYLTSLIGVEAFKKVFPVILTDNGSEFRRARDIERTVEGQRRTRLFFCDPYTSWQKPHIEKNHGFVRYVLKKGKSFNQYTQQDMTLLANHINSIRRAGLDDCCPYELVVDPNMKLLLSLLDLEQVPSDEVFLKPSLLHQR
jgi:IS30 family transposase